MCHRWEQAVWTPGSDSWCQRGQQWTDRRNLSPHCHFLSRCPHRSPVCPARETCSSLIGLKSSSRTAQLSYLLPTQANVKVMEISEAFVGEAGTALEAGDVGQSREVIVHSFSFCGQHVQIAVAAAGSRSLHAHTHHLWCKYHLEYSSCSLIQDMGPSIYQCINGDTTRFTSLRSVFGPQGIQASTPTDWSALMMVFGGQLLHTPVPLTM